MAKENCTLIDEYKATNIRIKYLYNNEEFTVRFGDWLNKQRPSRPHLKGGNRITKPHKKWNNEKVNELFQKENCELIDEYRSTKQILKYKYNNSYYWTTLDDWIHHNSRPHLYINNEQKFREYLEESNIQFITQKSYDDLKTKNNYKMRFDFYLLDYNLLVEIDDKSHINSKDQIENGKLKDKYCIDNKIKLLRIDDTVDKDDFDEALTNILKLEDDIYVLKYGNMYKKLIH